MSTDSPSYRRIDLHYILLQAGFWAMFASICAYQAALLLERGFSNSEVGTIISVRCLTGIFSQPLFGIFADRHPKFPLKHLVSLSFLFSIAVSAGLIFLPLGFGGTVAVFALIGAFETSAYPLIDTLAIQYINDGIPLHYSLGRGIGSVAYAICCVLLGWLTTARGMESVLWVHIVLVAAEALIAATFPTHIPQRTSRRDAPEDRPHAPLTLLRTHPRFSVMMAASLFSVFGVIALSNFLVNVTTAKGGDTQALGLGLFLMGVFELPTAFLYPKLKRRFGTDGLMVMSMLFCAAKCAAFLAAPTVGWLLAAQSLQMLGYGLFTPTSVFFVNENVPAADRTQGQTLMMVAGNGLGGVLGSFFIGRALDFGGINFALALCLAACLIAALLAWFALRLPKEISKEEPT